jgi:hypothetical protein
MKTMLHGCAFFMPYRLSSIDEMKGFPLALGSMLLLALCTRASAALQQKGCGPVPRVRPDVVLAKVRTCRDLIFWYGVANKKAKAWPNRPVVIQIHPRHCPTT